LIEDRVEPLVDYLLIRIGIEPVEDLTCAECEGNRAVNSGIGLWTEIRGAQIQTGTDKPERPRWVYCI
jgi:hypothetical protein